MIMPKDFYDGMDDPIWFGCEPCGIAFLENKERLAAGLQERFKELLDLGEKFKFHDEGVEKFKAETRKFLIEFFDAEHRKHS